LTSCSRRRRATDFPKPFPSREILQVKNIDVVGNKNA
jgi:hypothetical protein